MGFFDLFKKKKKSQKDNLYKLGLHKTKKESFSKIGDILKRSKKIDDVLFDSLEEIFIMADVGVETVCFLTEELKKECKNKKIENPLMLESIIIDNLFKIYTNNSLINSNLNYKDNELNVYLFVGVNGVGKTTSIGKIANRFKNMGKKVLLCCGDTFRAGAKEQLIEWAKRSGCDVVYKDDGTDPSAVIYEACKKAKEQNYDVLLCDTAGRLQTKVNLMKELEKIKKVITQNHNLDIKDTLLVIDATCGQNGLIQAKSFNEVCNISGIILTKLDGTSKGGIVLAIKNIFNIPIKFVGLGEGISDLEVFDIESYLYGLFNDFFES